MSNLKPFRDYDDHDVINLFTVSGSSVDKGTFVVAQGNGINLKDATTIDNISPYANSQSAQFNVPWAAIPASFGALKGNVVGMLLKDVRTYDENGEKLIFKPRKAAEMDVVISGQAAPILTKGVVLYSGIAGTPSFGSGAATDANGQVVVTGYLNSNNTTIGKFLGPKNDEGYALLKIEL